MTSRDAMTTPSARSLAKAIEIETTCNHVLDLGVCRTCVAIAIDEARSEALEEAALICDGSANFLKDQNFSGHTARSWEAQELAARIRALKENT